MHHLNESDNKKTLLRDLTNHAKLVSLSKYRDSLIL